MKFIRLFIFLIFITSQVSSNAQTPPPPPPSDHGGAGNATANGGGAPIGDGVGFLLVLGFAYGIKKLYENRQLAAASRLDS